MTITAPPVYGGCSCENALGNGGFMAFGALASLTAIGTALPDTGAAAHGYAHARARVKYAPATAYGIDGVPLPPPKNTRRQIRAL